MGLQNKTRHKDTKAQRHKGAKGQRGKSPSRQPPEAQEQNEKHKNKPIGIFDSGVGGLTVLKEIRKLLPYERLIYLGDTARLPYGAKSKSAVIKFSLQNLDFLLKRKVKLVVAACNTASALAIPALKRASSVPIVDVLEPAVICAAKATRSKRIGVIGTRATINSAAYEKRIKKLDVFLKVISRACPLFVPLVEEGWLESASTLSIARTYLLPLKKEKVDTLILGCTHYPMLKKVIARVMGRGVRLIDSAVEVAAEVEKFLGKRGMLSDRKLKSRARFYVSDEPISFKTLGAGFLNEPAHCARGQGRGIANVKKIEL